MRQPPVTGGKNATSSPGRDARRGVGEILVHRAAHRATIGEGAAWPGLRAASHSIRSPTVRTSGGRRHAPPPRCRSARAARRSTESSAGASMSAMATQRGVGTVSIVPSEWMIVLVPLPFGTTIAEPPPGRGDGLIAAGAAGGDCRALFGVCVTCPAGLGAGGAGIDRRRRRSGLGSLLAPGWFEPGGVELPARGQRRQVRRRRRAELRRAGHRLLRTALLPCCSSSCSVGSGGSGPARHRPAPASAGLHSRAHRAPHVLAVARRKVRVRARRRTAGPTTCCNRSRRAPGTGQGRAKRRMKQGSPPGRGRRPDRRLQTTGGPGEMCPGTQCALTTRADSAGNCSTHPATIAAGSFSGSTARSALTAAHRRPPPRCPASRARSAACPAPDDAPPAWGTGAS